MSGGWTKGVFLVEESTCCYQVMAGDVCVAEVGYDGLTPGVQAECDANLIAEAFNVANETGLPPRELADQRAELLATLILLAAHDFSPGDKLYDGICRRARALIAKCTGAA